MKTTGYKIAWDKLNQAQTQKYTEADIASIISGQSEESASGLTRYLWFDLGTKALFLTILFIDLYLFWSSPQMFPLLIGAIIGLVLALFQWQVTKNNKALNFNLPVRDLVKTTMQILRKKIGKGAVLVGFTNPIIILSGSFVYYYFKYGTGFIQSQEDALVTFTFMLIGFILGFAAFTVQQSSILTDLEIGLELLNSDDNDGLMRISKRRRRRQLVIITLMILGTAIFITLLLLIQIIL